MSASFAKAIIPRHRRDTEPRREPDWSLGWIVPENEADATEPSAAGAPIHIVALHDESPSNTAHD